MKRRCTLLAVVIAIAIAIAIAVAAGAGSSPALASGAAGPDTTTVSCTSSQVWLRISASAGQSCYTGTGSLPVSLQGVSEAQVVGAHLACLTFSTGGKDCIQGPQAVRFQPPRNVTGISLD